jgi:hypothetical protein
MIIEHLFYSAALAILIGMVFYEYTRRDSSWIIIVCAFIPDLDFITNPVLRSLGVRLIIDGSSIHHGTFHTLLFMVLFGIVVAFLLYLLGIRFFDALFFSMIGFGAHLVEDWFAPVIHEENYVTDFFRIANTDVLILSLVLLLAAILIRTYGERSSSWIRWYMPEKLYLIISGKYRADTAQT